MNKFYGFEDLMADDALGFMSDEELCERANDIVLSNIPVCSREAFEELAGNIFSNDA